MKTPILLVCSLFLAFGAVAARGISLPNVFGDNMVLQRGQKIPVWGKGAPGEQVTVEFAGQSVSAQADETGRWRLDLAPLAASAEGAVFRARGDNEVVFTNVVVGEVWFCSGQSNMEFTMSARRKVKDWEKEVAAADWPLIRHFRAPHKVAAEPCDDIDAHWVPTTPETIPPQSAVAFFFGETLFRELGVPVGLINCSWGGTRIEPWTLAGGDANKYDFNDKPVPDAVQGLGYGCLQVHDLATKTTVLAFNHFNSSSLPCDVGIGKCTGEHPDWTFARNGGAYKARRLSVWVK